MKPVPVFLVICAALAGCNQPESGTATDYPSGRAATAASAEGGRNKYLAYEHSVSVDTGEDEAKRLYEKLITTCKTDAANECTVLDSRITTGRNVSANIKIRSKPEGIQGLIKLVSSTGDVINQGTHVEDLARPIVDNAKRLDMLKSYQARLLKLEREAGRDVDSLIKISKELSTVQSQLEQATGENAHLLARVNLDILNIYIGTRLNRSFWSPVGDALSDFASNLSRAISSVVTGLAYGLPWLVVIAIFVVLGRKFWRRKTM